MKPDEAMRTEMDDAELVPGELFQKLGMLVVESRVPDPSPKGRTEGPHCPAAPNDAHKHTCNQKLFVCQRADSMRRQMSMLWRNQIPMCIEVLLYRDCAHGQQRSMSLDPGLPSARENCLLLEQWTIQPFPRRSCDSSVRPRELFQAIRSYLFFSQLSAWLNLTQGLGPRSVAYRISPPGEFCTSTFSEPPQWHTFPVCTVGRSLALKVTAGSLPRRPEVWPVVCPDSHTLTCSLELKTRKDTIDKGATGRKKSPPPVTPPQNLPLNTNDYGVRRRSHQFSDCAQGSHSRRRSMQPLATKTPTADLMPLQNFQVRLMPPAPDLSLPLPMPPLKKESGAIAKQPMHKSPPYRLWQPPPPLPEWGPQALSAPQSEALPPPGGGAGGLPLVSPKVLVTKKAPAQAYYQREESWWAKGVAASDSTDSDQSSPEIDRYLKDLRSTGAPLSPEEIQTYLASLSRPRRHSKDTSPLARAASPALCRELSFQTTNPPDNLLRITKLDLELAENVNNHNDSSVEGNDTGSPTAQTKDPSPRECRHGLPTNSLSSPASQLPCSCPVLPTSSTSNGAGKVCFHIGDEEEEKEPQNGVQKILASPAGLLPTPQQSDPTLPGHSKAVSPSEDSSLGASKMTTPDAHRGISLVGRQVRQSTSPELQNGAKYELQNGGMSKETDTYHRNGYSLVEAHQHKLTPDSSKVSTKNESVVERRDQCGADQGYAAVTNGTARDSDSLSAIQPPPILNGAAPKPDSDDRTLVKRAAPKPAGSVDQKPLGCAIPKPEPSDKTPGFQKSNPLLRNIMCKDLKNQIQESVTNGVHPVPSAEEKAAFRKSVDNSANMLFNRGTGLPLQSSPAPIKKRTSHCFDFDSNLTNVRAIKSSLSCANLKEKAQPTTDENDNSTRRFYSTSAPASTNSLLGNFEESLLNGRIEPSGVVDGFTAEIGASGLFCPKHISLPVSAFFFNLSDDNAPSPYLGHINLDSMGKRGYHVPKKGTVQVTLFNPNKTVVKMFVVMYNMSDMPPNCQTFLRQRTLYMPIKGSPSDLEGQPLYLRYLIHLRFSSSKSGKIYLHTDIRLIFAREKLEYDSRVAHYELRSFTEGPTNPKFSPKR